MDAAKKYEYIKTLGEGSYGHVWLCRDRERDCLVAIKKFKDANKDSQAYHLAMREIKLLRATSHEHVVSVIEAFRSQSSGNVYLVMEYAESCLNLELKKHRTGLPTADVMRITWQLASALQYLHSRKIVHRDLKPANILLTAAGDLKLCDFGFARDLPPAGQQADMSSYVTTRWYRAPEVVVGAEYGAAVDIWALGCLFAELLNGQPLFPGASNMDQLALIVACFGHLPNRLLAKALTNPQLVGVQLRTGNPRNWAVALQQRFAPYGENAVTLLLSCLNPDPLKRATAEEVLRAPYFEPIRQKKVSSLNGPPTIAITVSTTTPPSCGSATVAPAATAAAAPAATNATGGPVHPAAAIPPPAAASATATAAEPSSGAAAAKAAPEAAPLPPASQQQQQQPPGVATPSTDGTRRISKETEPQPERPAPPPVTVHAAAEAAVPGAGQHAEGAAGAAAPPGSAALEPLQASSRQVPAHPAVVMVAPRPSPPPAAAAAEPSPKELEPEAPARLGAATDMEVDTPPSALAQPSAAQPQRQAAQVRFMPQPIPSFRGQAQQTQAQAQGYQAQVDQPGTRQGTGATAAAQDGGDARQLQAVQQQKDSRLTGGLTHLRASMAAIPMSGVSVAARAMTDTGLAAVPGTSQVTVLAAQGKAGATLVQHTKRASEHNLGVYGNHRGVITAGVQSDLPMRLARVSLVNPNMDVSQLAAENASASSSPATTPTGAAPAAAASAGAAAAGGGGALQLISPANSLVTGAHANGGNAIAAYVAGTGRRRSTATGSRLTRVSHTNEGQEGQPGDDDSDEDRSSGGAGAPGGVAVGAGAHPSPRQRHSRLSSVTEPGGQLPPGAMPAARMSGAGGAAVAATEGGGFDHHGRGPSAPQMLSPLGRSSHQLGHHAANALSGGVAPAAGPSSTAASLLSDGAPGHHLGGATAQQHGALHSTMSAVSLNVLNMGAAARERERERERVERESLLAEAAGGTLRSNAVAGIATPAAPTASQRSFTSQAVSTSAAAAGLMSRPVSNLYINVDHHGFGGVVGRVPPHQETPESNSGDSSSAVSPSTPTGGGGGGHGGGSVPAPPPVAAAPSAAVSASVSSGGAAAASSRRTTFTDGPSSMFKSVLRTLSTRRSTNSSHSTVGGGVEQQQQAVGAAAAAAVAAQPTGSIGGAPPAGSHGSLSVAIPCGAAHSQSSQSSGGISPFIPSRASSHNFISGAPAERAPVVDVPSSLSVPGGSEDYSAAVAAAAALRRSVTVSHGVSGGSGSVGGVVGGMGGNPRIGLPHLNVRIPEGHGVGGGGGAVAAGPMANGYGSAVVSPAGRRRSQLTPSQASRTSDAGVVIMAAAGLRQASSGSMSGAPGGHQGCKPTTALHGEMMGVGVGVPGLVGGAALPVVRNPAPPTEAAQTRLGTKGSREL